MLLYKHIAIEGNIGAGKTTLAKFLTDHLSASLLLEEFEDNDFLQDFYTHNRFAIHAEIQFLLDRSKQLFKFHQQSHELIITDYVTQKSLLFSKMNLTVKDFELISKLMDSIFHSIPQPDLLIFLTRPISELEDNIKNRGRKYEAGITPEYLINLNKAYDNFLGSITNIPVLQIRANEIDLSRPEKLINKFSEIFSKKHENGLKRIYLQ